MRHRLTAEVSVKTIAAFKFNFYFIFLHSLVHFYFINWSQLISLTLSLNGARTMKLFSYLRRQYKLLGISPIQNGETHARNCVHLFFVSQISVTALIYLICEAKSIPEYIDSFYIFSTGAVNIFCSIVIISNMSNIFQLIEKLEKAIERRNQQAIYTELNERTQEFSKKFHFIFVPCTTFGVVMPILLTTLFTYLTTDLGSDAFQLPFLAS